MEPKIVPVSTGEVLEFSEWAAVIKIAADATNGTLTVIETRHAPGHSRVIEFQDRRLQPLASVEERLLEQQGQVVVAPSGHRPQAEGVEEQECRVCVQVEPRTPR